jgi:MoxR-like ATPase
VSRSRARRPSRRTLGGTRPRAPGTAAWTTCWRPPRDPDNIEQVIEGKPEVVKLALVVLLAEGHLLIEDVPGRRQDDARQVARPLDRLLGAPHPVHPDLLPSDVTGVSIFDQESREFEFKPGAVFANLVVGDEINRASPKTQSALLEAMEERQVSVDGVTYVLETPFMVIATQNPIEMEGTYPLPEAQRDRFTARASIGYPSPQPELDAGEPRRVEPIEDLEPGRRRARGPQADRGRARVHLSDEVKQYVVDLVGATRSSPDLRLGRLPPRRACSWCAPPAPAPRWTAATTCCPTTCRSSPSRSCATACCRPPTPRSSRRTAADVVSPTCVDAHARCPPAAPPARGASRSLRARSAPWLAALRAGGLTTRGPLPAGRRRRAGGVLPSSSGQRDLLRAAVFLVALPLAAVAIVSAPATGWPATASLARRGSRPATRRPCAHARQRLAPAQRRPAHGGRPAPYASAGGPASSSTRSSRAACGR